MRRKDNGLTNSGEINIQISYGAICCPPESVIEVVFVCVGDRLTSRSCKLHAKPIHTYNHL